MASINVPICFASFGFCVFNFLPLYVTFFFKKKKKKKRKTAAQD